MNKWFIVLIIISILGASSIALFNYVNYESENIVQNFLVSNEKINVIIKDNIINFQPKIKKEIGIIFYPGGLVSPEAYAPLCFNLSKEGYDVFLIKMPLNLAVFNINAAKKIIDKVNYKNWLIIGHSLGGAMASKFIYDNPDLISGLILLASYPAETNNLSNYNIKVLSIYGELDGLATKEKIEKYKLLLPKNTKYIMINGGNHSNFGYYGFQKGDNKSTITKEKQQKIILKEILSFLSNL
ncbi:alpha/beta fold hydrolase [Marinitoga sp. 38H-ov]|uniref:alpha/beta fold hydrolase n=1 Tax=Marinitoga sp. 38H-ov TaxID=1755814 RepID=UPI0013EC8CA9|nr:alpha/beta fold hydrolase [Marinitoga sp. 38H-ov]KAF2956906.1 hypothetical protein AS160_02665 [Marinitoga sp. 38H-ov]